ncbi:MAG: hypothetical protein ACE5KZ_05755 [Candidatus Scalinduaceae bacterium]
MKLLSIRNNTKNITVSMFLVFFVVACVAIEESDQNGKGAPKAHRAAYVKPATRMTIESYEEAGKWWGLQLKNKKPGYIDKTFAAALIDENDLKYFTIHPQLKEAFKKGFRFGYENRIADLVLGPHFQIAAGHMGKEAANNFVDVIQTFEKGLIEILENAINVFVTLIAEASQAERGEFVGDFIEIYKEKYNKTQKLIKLGSVMFLTSHGGPLIHFDIKKTQGALDIPSPHSLRDKIYKRTFKAMGDEMGKRYSNNLIKRDELIEWMRRSKSALNMDYSVINPKIVGENLKLIEEAFVKSYGTDAKNVFDGIVKEAGYK